LFDVAKRALGGISRDPQPDYEVESLYLNRRLWPFTAFKSWIAWEASLRFKYSATPEEKLDTVRQETAKAKTLYVGDGINDAPAMMAATVGMATDRTAM
jgi:hypothetical protein